MFTLLFVLMLLAGVATRLWLATRQTRHVALHRDRVPAEFTDRIGETSHRRAADYTIARIRFDIVALLFDTSVLIGLTLLGGLQALNELAASLASSDFVRQLLLVAMAAALLSVVDLPFTLWRQFVLEARFGFNRMTWRLFAADTVKGLALAVLFGLPLLSALLWLMADAGPTGGSGAGACGSCSTFRSCCCFPRSSPRCSTSSPRWPTRRWPSVSRRWPAAPASR